MSWYELQEALVKEVIRVRAPATSVINPGNIDIRLPVCATKISKPMGNVRVVLRAKQKDKRKARPEVSAWSQAADGLNNFFHPLVHEKFAPGEVEAAVRRYIELVGKYRNNDVVFARKIVLARTVIRATRVRTDIVVSGTTAAEIEREVAAELARLNEQADVRAGETSWGVLQEGNDEDRDRGAGAAEQRS